MLLSIDWSISVSGQWTSANYQPTVDCQSRCLSSVNLVSTEHWSSCWLSVDQEVDGGLIEVTDQHLTTDAFSAGSKVLSHSGLTLYHLIIIGKYFLYINAVQDEKRPQFTDFVTLVNEKVELEKYIAITTNKLLSFAKKWSNYLNNQLLEASVCIVP